MTSFTLFSSCGCCGIRWIYNKSQWYLHFYALVCDSFDRSCIFLYCVLSLNSLTVNIGMSVSLYPCSTEISAHPSLVGSKVYFFWSPTEDYCVTVWWIWFVFVDYQVSVWRVWRGLMRWKWWKRPMKELIPLFHRAFCSSFTRRKQGLFLLITHGRLSCHSQMNLICVYRLSGQCLACQVWSDEVKMSGEGTKCRA